MKSSALPNVCVSLKASSTPEAIRKLRMFKLAEIRLDGMKIKRADMLRGGAFKPRTSPYSFQGWG